MTQSTTQSTTQIDPFTHNLLRNLAVTIPAQPNETEAEYERRFAAATNAWAALRPRDPMEQMLASQIVSARISPPSTASTARARPKTRPCPTSCGVPTPPSPAPCET